MPIGNLLKNLVFPSACVGCGKSSLSARSNEWVCQACFTDIPLHPWIFCGLCGKRLLGVKKCASHQSSALHAVGVAADYGNTTLHAMILAYKYRFIRELREPLADILMRYFVHAFLPLLPDKLVFTPIPLTARRFRWRGFNQADDLAGLLSQKTGIIVDNLLLRTSHRKPQKEVAYRKERFENVRDVFRVRDEAQVRDRHIIIVDDVTTSGATLESAGRTLKDAGAKSVWGLVIARG